MNEFEFDPAKNKINKEKHGIDFVKAKELWQRDRVIIPARKVSGESRFAIVGTIQNKHYVAIFTQRKDKIRIISCHPADKKWRKIYEKYVQEF